LLNSTRAKIKDSSRLFSNLTEQANTIQAQVRARRVMLTGLSERTKAVSETTGLLKTQLDETLLRHITTMTEVNGDLRVESLCSGRVMNQSGSGTGQLVFSSLRVIYGDLFISTSSCPWLKSISFPRLEIVRDSIEVSKNRFLERVDFPSLIKTENAHVSLFDNEILHGFSYPLLQTSAGAVLIDNNTRLTGIITFDSLQSSGGFFVRICGLVTGISLPRFTDCGFVFDVFNDLLLIGVDAPVLRAVSGLLRIHSNPNLININMPLLTTVTVYLELSLNHKLEVISLPSLVSVGNDFQITLSNSLRIARFPSLVSVSSDLFIIDNHLLEEIDFPKLTSVGKQGTDLVSDVGSISIFGNPRLLSIESLCVSLQVVYGDRVEVCDNPRLALLPSCIPSLFSDKLCSRCAGEACRCCRITGTVCIPRGKGCKPSL
jgi:hypothetical protein